MEMKMYSIKDELSGFAPAIPFSNTEMAQRYFKTQLKTNPIMEHQPADFSLWEMGTFDTETGFYDSSVEMIERG